MKGDKGKNLKRTNTVSKKLSAGHSAIWLVKRKAQNKQMHCRFSPSLRFIRRLTPYNVSVRTRAACAVELTSTICSTQNSVQP